MWMDRMGQTDKKFKHGHSKIKFGLVWSGLVWLNHVWCDLLSWFGLIKFSSVNFVLFGSVRIFTNKKIQKNKNGLKYRVAAQLKIDQTKHNLKQPKQIKAYQPNPN